MDSSKTEIDITKFEIVKEISESPRSNVYLIQDQDTANKYNAIVINKEYVDDDSDDEGSQEEEEEDTLEAISNIAHIQHPTIIKYVGFSLHDLNGKNNTTIITQTTSNGSLLDLFKQEESGSAPSNYDSTARQIILAGIARGMILLHQNNYLNDELKPENILLDENFHPHITSFYLSKLSKSKKSQYSSHPIYDSPETIENTQFNEKSDVYSFGILMFQIVTGKRPFSELAKKSISNFKFIQKVLNGMRPEFTRHVKPSIKRLICRCWDEDPDKRPTFDELFDMLAYSKDSIVFEDSDDDDEKSDTEDVDDNGKFFLDGVDLDTLNEYVESIKDDVVESLSRGRSSRRKKSKKAKSDSDDEEEKPASKKSKKTASKSSGSDDEEEKPASKKSKKTASKHSDSDEDDEEERKPASKKSKKTASKLPGSDDDEDEEERKPASKKSKKTASKHSDSDSDDDDGGGERAKKASSKKGGGSDEDDEEETKPGGKKPSSGSDDEEDVESLVNRIKKGEKIGLIKVDISDRLLDSNSKKLGAGLVSTTYSVQLGSATDDDSSFIIFKSYNDQLFQKKSTTTYDASKSTRFISEIESVQKLNDANIQKSIGYFEGGPTKSPFYLFHFLSANLVESVKKLEDFQLVTVIYEVAHAMFTAHAKNLVHRDLKPENVLIDSENHAHVCDFGISTLMKVEDQVELVKKSTKNGFLFLSPQILLDEDYDEKADVYSFGMIMYFVLSRGKFLSAKMEDVTDGKSFHIPKFINKISYSIIKKCLSYLPQDRPSFKAIVDTIVRNNFALVDGIESKIDDVKNQVGSIIDKKHLKKKAKKAEAKK